MVDDFKIARLCGFQNIQIFLNLGIPSTVKPQTNLIVHPLRWVHLKTAFTTDHEISCFEFKGEFF